MRTRHLNGLLIVAILIISTAPLFAQGQQPDAAKLKADARNIVGVVGSDKAKTHSLLPNRDCRWADATGRSGERQKEV
jgi:hypothetical protein